MSKLPPGYDLYVEISEKYEEIYEKYEEICEKYEEIFGNM